MGSKIAGCVIQEAYSGPSSLSDQDQKPHMLDAQNQMLGYKKKKQQKTKMVTAILNVAFD